MSIDCSNFYPKAGLDRLAEQLPFYYWPEFEILAAQLLEVEQDLATYGSCPSMLQARMRVVAQLDALTHQMWGPQTTNTFTRLAQCREDRSSIFEPVIRIDFEAGLARLSDLVPASARSAFESLAAHLREALEELKLLGVTPRAEEIKWGLVRSLNDLAYGVFGPETPNTFTWLCQVKEDASS